MLSSALARLVPEASAALCAILDVSRGPVPPPIRSEIFGQQRFALGGVLFPLQGQAFDPVLQAGDLAAERGVVHPTLPVRHAAGQLVALLAGADLGDPPRVAPRVEAAGCHEAGQFVVSDDDVVGLVPGFVVRG